MQADDSLVHGSNCGESFSSANRVRAEVQHILSLELELYWWVASIVRYRDTFAGSSSFFLTNDSPNQRADINCSVLRAVKVLEEVDFGLSEIRPERLEGLATAIDPYPRSILLP